MHPYCKMAHFKIKKLCPCLPYWKMAAIEDGGEIGVKQSVGQNKNVKGTKLSGTKVICIIIRSTA